MNPEITIRAADVIGSPLGVSSDDGQQLHDRVAPMLKEGRKVVLSFAGIEILISAFLNAAIGQLYGEFSEQAIRDQLTVRDMSSEDLALLKRVVENAKRYFANRESFDHAWNEEVNGSEDEEESKP